MKIIKKAYLVLCLVLFSSFVFGNSVSLEEKIGQMLIVGFEGKDITEDSPIVKAIKHDHIGGVILFDYDNQTKTFGKNISSPIQVQTLNKKLQAFNSEANKNKHLQNLPLLISLDYEGGTVVRLPEAYGFPKTYSAKEVGQMTTPEASQIAYAMGSTLKENGFNLNFAPVLDTEINPDNPIIAKRERSFSAQPEVVAKYGAIYSKQFLAQGVECAYKHFPGHGSSTSDSHLGFVDVTDTWHEQELIPFQKNIYMSHHCGFMMTAHIVNRKLDSSGLPATLSHPILTGLLRNEMGYDGVIITDDMQMKAIADHYGLENALTLAINAGADMFIFGNQFVSKPQDPAELIQIIAHKVKNGEISEQRINEAYRRIVNLKKNLLIS